VATKVWLVERKRRNVRREKRREGAQVVKAGRRRREKNVQSIVKIKVDVRIYRG